MKIVFSNIFLFICFIGFSQGKWTKKLDLPDTARIEACAFTINGKGYLITGRQAAAYFRDVWEFNPLNNTWLKKADFPGTARREGVAFSVNGKGYIGTGRDASGAFKDFWEYNPVLDSWTRKANFPGGVRRDATGFSIGNKGYIGTGQDPTGSVNKNDFWEYDPATDMWTQRTNFPGIARNAAIGFSIGAKGYIGLGRNSSVEYKDIYEFNPANNTWLKRADFAPGTREEVVSFLIGNIAYVGTGYTSAIVAGNKADFWAFDPSANTWTQIDTLTAAARVEATSFEINGKGYISTGSGSAGSLNDLWEYDPSAKTIILDEKFPENIMLYPNPIQNQVTIELKGVKSNKKFAVQLFTSEGKEYIVPANDSVSDGSTKIIVSTENLNSGVYFLHLTSTENSLKFKIMVVK